MTGEAITVQDAAGSRLEAEVVDRGVDGGLTVRVADGRRLIIPADAIVRRDGAHIELGRRFADAEAPGRARVEERTVPIVEEQALVEKRERPTATVRVRTETEAREEFVDELLERETVDVERVSVDRIVTAPVPIRHEGDTTIVSLHEEVLVVEKRLLLKEEIHLTKRRDRQRETTRVELRSQRADIERHDPDEAASAASREEGDDPPWQ